MHPIARKIRLFEYLGNDVVLDVGASKGQFAENLRSEIGYKNKIISFEPLCASFRELESKASKDDLWEVCNYALGDIDAEQEINVSENSYSSSFLEILPSHIKAAPYAKFVGKEQVQIKTLDSIFNDICSVGQKIYLKIDTQGFERQVLNGAENSLKNIQCIQMEMSLEQLYQGELRIDETIEIMKEKGYRLISLEPGFSEWKTGRLLQADGIFSHVT